MLASRMSKFSGSATTAVSDKVAELRAAGKNIISLNIGEPDFNTPENIKQAGIQAIVDNNTRYSTSNGIADLRKLIAKKLELDNNLHYSAEQICIGVGAKQCLFDAIMAVAEAGDEVLLPIPCWVSYTELIKLAGATPVFVPVDNANGYVLDLDAIEKAITPNTKAIIICTPNNPTGAVYSEESLRKLAELAVKHDFYVIADEIYEKAHAVDEHISRGTVYRNLGFLAESGEILKISVPNQADHYDSTLREHYHFCCSNCGKMCDVPEVIKIEASDAKIKQQETIYQSGYGSETDVLNAKIERCNQMIELEQQALTRAAACMTIRYLTE